MNHTFRILAIALAAVLSAGVAFAQDETSNTEQKTGNETTVETQTNMDGSTSASSETDGTQTDASADADVSADAEVNHDTDTESHDDGEVKRRKSHRVMQGQLRAIRARLGHKGEGTDQAREDFARISSEIEAELGADATPQEIRKLFVARSAGYADIEAMEMDVTAVLGEDANPGLVKSYLRLRQRATFSAGDGEPDYERIRQAVVELGDDLNPGRLRVAVTGKSKVRGRHADHSDHSDHSDRSGRDDDDDTDGSDEMERGPITEAELMARVDAAAAAYLDHIQAKADAFMAQAEARMDDPERLAEIQARVDARVDLITAKTEDRTAKVKNAIEMRGFVRAEHGGQGSDDD